MVAIVAVIALLLFIYVNRSIQNRRSNRREMMNERREELMEQFLASRQRKDTEAGDNQGDEPNAD